MGRNRLRRYGGQHNCLITLSRLHVHCEAQQSGFKTAWLLVKFQRVAKQVKLQTVQSLDTITSCCTTGLTHIRCYQKNYKISLKMSHQSQCQSRNELRISLSNQLDTPTKNFRPHKYSGSACKDCECNIYARACFTSSGVYVCLDNLAYVVRTGNEQN